MMDGSIYCSKTHIDFSAYMMPFQMCRVPSYHLRCWPLKWLQWFPWQNRVRVLKDHSHSVLVFSLAPCTQRLLQIFMIPCTVANEIFKVFPAFCCPIFFRPVAAIKFKMSEYFFQEILKCLSLNIQYVFSVLLWINYGFVRSPNHSVTQHSNFLELKLYCFWPRSPWWGVRSEESV